MPRRSRLPVALIAVLGLFSAVGGQEPAPPTTAPGPTATPKAVAPSLDETIEQRVERARESPELADAARSKVLETYAEARELLAEAGAAEARARELRELARTAPARLEGIRDELDAAAEPPAAVPEAASAAELEQALARAEAALQAAEKERARLDEQAQARSERRRELPTRLAEARQRLKQVERELATRQSGADDALDEAERIRLEAEQRALAARIAALEAELASYDARGDLLAARRDAAAREAEAAKKQAEALRSRLAAQRERELHAQQAEAKAQLRQAARTHPAVVSIAEENDALVERRAQLSAELERAATRADAVAQRVEEVETAFERARQKIAAVGLTDAIGLFLRQQREKLPSVPALRDERGEAQDRIGRIQLELMELDERRARLANLGAAVERRIADIDAATADGDAPIESVARELLAARQEYLGALRKDLDRHFDTLVELDTNIQRLITQTRAFEGYITENILWIPSGSPVGPETFVRVAEAIAALATPAPWRELLTALWRDLGRRPSFYAAYALLLVGGVIALRRCRLWLAVCAGLTRQLYSDRFHHTAYALFASLLIAGVGPALMWLAGWRLGRAAEGSDLAWAVGAGLHQAAASWFTLRFVAELARGDGLGAAHFRWRPELLELIRFHTRWLLPLVPPLIFLYGAAVAQSDDAHRESLGRLAFIGAMTALAVAVQRVLASRHGVLAEISRRAPGGWVSRFRGSCVALATAAPAALAAAAAAGYFFTASQLRDRIFSSVVLLLVLVLFNELSRRWLILEHKNLARTRARQRRAAETAAAPGSDPSGPAAAPDEDAGPSLSAISAQTRQLLRSATGIGVLVGLWLIWAPVLPALGVLNDITLWGGGEEAAITLGNVIVGALVGLLTAVAARNGPGLLEIVALQRLPISASARYATTTLSRYAITAVGVVIAFSMIGIGWSKVQWLVAAISVGLGFGLQEIFANFVSGIILLFERPVRVGDTVTVNGVSGTVSRIRTRATTIVDWDRKELVVPNRTFVTGDLVNWTLSDSILRVVIPVGVALGSETNRVERTLARLGREHRLVLHDPPPQVYFLGFGESSLSFELRVFIDSMDHFLQVKHELCTAIVSAFRDAGITIAYPQRDLHLRSVEQPIRLARSAGTAARPAESPEA